ncbi:MAG TPA: glutamine-hydrolyzing GMP synthase [Bacteroidota bacterium]|nr:glutamine-hydrolyzing GMP synthase [Bacteroidota bacterium]
MKHPELVVVLDFGAQYSQLIARRIRELGVYAELLPGTAPAGELRAKQPAGIVFSGGPASVYDPDAPHPDPAVYNMGVPILGICYGLQLIAQTFGGEVNRSAKREFGPADVRLDDRTDLFRDLGTPPAETTRVWMSHGDALTGLPPGFEAIAHSDNSPICAVRHRGKRIYGVQFHPEVVHSVHGTDLLRNFVYGICGCRGGWSAGFYVERAVGEIRAVVGDGRVLCALSGGVDSSVLAVLIHRAIGDRLTCVHIDTGLMRKDESAAIVRLYRDHYRFDLRSVDARELFLTRLAGVADPEQKRKIIGKTFIEVFEKEAASAGSADFLAQGTLYPDVIESVSYRGPSHTIKSHHNVGGLPDRMKLKLLEPFRELFKDEVRAVGRLLGLPDELIMRHPFPGPGLAVRIIGAVTAEKLSMLREADAVFIEEIRRAGLYEHVWQAFAVFLPVQTVGVMGDQRTYDSVIALRAVSSVDGMTADWYPFPPEVLARAASRIVNEVRGINRVVYDISSKPPSTIEWE